MQKYWANFRKTDLVANVINTTKRLLTRSCAAALMRLIIGSASLLLGAFYIDKKRYQE
jgi:hypothetical protein